MLCVRLILSTCCGRDVDVACADMHAASCVGAQSSVPGILRLLVDSPPHGPAVRSHHLFYRGVLCCAGVRTSLLHGWAAVPALSTLMAVRTLRYPILCILTCRLSCHHRSLKMQHAHVSSHIACVCASSTVAPRC